LRRRSQLHERAVDEDAVEPGVKLCPLFERRMFLNALMKVSYAASCASSLLLRNRRATEKATSGVPHERFERVGVTALQTRDE
jgi:hypothetical protein